MMSTEPAKPPEKRPLRTLDQSAPNFSHFTDPLYVSPDEKRRAHSLHRAGELGGAAVGAAGGAAVGKYLGGTKGALIGGLGGALAGYRTGQGLAQHHVDNLTVKREQAVADRERAQEHRKELLDKKKEASVHDDRVHILGADPFGIGGAVLGYRRGKETGRGRQGAARGALGTWGGGAVGAALGGLPGKILMTHGGEASRMPGLMLTSAGLLGGGIVGSAIGAHQATRGMLEKASMLGGPAVMPFQKALLNRVGTHTEQELADRLVSQAGKALPHVAINMKGVPGNGMFNFMTRSVTAPAADAHLLAHELGHAHIDNSRFGKLLQNAGTLEMGTQMPNAGFAGGLASGYSDENSGKSHLGRDALIGGALSAPQLMYEAGATAKGHQLLKDVGASPESMAKYRSRTGHALGTYALQPVAGAINYGIGRRLGQMASRSDQKAKAARTAREEGTMKKSSFDGVMMAAMADELRHMHQEKVAINVAQVGGFLGNMASKATAAAPGVMGALGQVGGHVVGGLETAGRAALNQGGHLATGGGHLLGGLNSAEKALGGGLAGARTMNQLAGAGAVGAGALGVGAAGLAANRMLRRPTTTVNVQR